MKKVHKQITLFIGALIGAVPFLFSGLWLSVYSGTACAGMGGRVPYFPLIRPINNVGFHVLNTLSAKNNISFSPFNLFNFSITVGGSLAPDQRSQVFSRLGITDLDSPAVVSGLEEMIYSSRDDVEGTDLGKMRAGSWALLEGGRKKIALAANLSRYDTEVRYFQSDNSIYELNRLNHDISDFTDGKLNRFVSVFTPLLPVNFFSVFYFRESWTKEFTRLEEKQYFETLSGPQLRVMMRQEYTSIECHRDGNEGWTAVNLPCKDPTVSLLLVMPDQIGKPLTAETFRNIYGKLSQESNVNVTLPLFRVNFQFPDIKGSLKDFGLPDTLSFEGTDIVDMDWSAIHQSIMDVNEKGMELADGVGMCGSSLDAPPPQEINFNKPFYFMAIRSGGAILGMGQVTDPEQPEDLLDPSGIALESHSGGTSLLHYY